MPEVTVDIAADAFVLSSQPHMSPSSAIRAGVGGRSYLRVSDGNASTGNPPMRISFLYANLPFPRGVDVTSAILEIPQKGAATGGSRTITADLNRSGWAESSVTWSNRPLHMVGISPVSTTLGNSAQDGRLWSWNVTTLMQHVSDGADWFGFRLMSNLTQMIEFYGRSSPEHLRPRLRVEWVERPSTPSQLSPSANRAVSLARPVHRFGYDDNLGQSTMAAFQIQVHSSNAWGSPLIDTGEVEASVGEWAMTADVPVGATRWWRVRVKTVAGVWSPWSEPDRYRRVAKPVVTMVSPTDDGVIYEPQPTTAWTVTGGTQVAYQIWIEDAATGALVNRTMRHTTDATSHRHSITTGRRYVPGGRYRHVLYVWDGESREATPGDPAHVVSRVEFSFLTDASVEPVDDLTLTLTDEPPSAGLAWSRTQNADAFYVVRDGVIVAELDPDEIRTSATTYAWTDIATPLRRGVTWGVLAGEEGRASEPVEVTGSVAPTGIWLSSLDGQTRIRLPNRAGDRGDPISLSSDEDVAVHGPLGADDAVVITQSVRGRRGSLTAACLSADADAWNRLTGRENRGQPLVMQWVNEAAIIHPLNAIHAARHEYVDNVPVGFDFVQVG